MSICKHWIDLLLYFTCEIFTEINKQSTLWQVKVRSHVRLVVHRNNGELVLQVQGLGHLRQAVGKTVNLRQVFTVFYVTY